MRFLVIVMMLSLLSCNNKKNKGGDTSSDTNTEDRIAQVEKSRAATNTTEATPQKRMATKSKTASNLFDEILAEPCGLININELGKMMKIDSELIRTKDGSTSKTKSARSCFFRWDGEHSSNSGVLIQVQSNPIPNEFFQYGSTFIASKLNTGEQAYDGVEEISFKFKPFNGIGDDGAYNHELGKYFWRQGEDIVFMLAFNLGLDEKEQLSLARKLAKMVMGRYE